MSVKIWPNGLGFDVPLEDGRILEIYEGRRTLIARIRKVDGYLQEGQWRFPRGTKLPEIKETVLNQPSGPTPP